MAERYPLADITSSYAGRGRPGSEPSRAPWVYRPVGFLTLILLLQMIHVALRPVLTPTVGTDDVDQLFFAQMLQAGYSYEQTPLYTWIIWLTIQVLGPTVIAVGLVKYSLVFLIHAFTYLAARQLIRDPRLQVFAGLAPMTLYPIGWRLHEADTYGILSTVCMMALTWAVLWLLRERRLVAYLVLGLSLGAGLLSSGYFGVGALALLLALPFAPAGRRAMLHWGFPLALILAALLVLPYGLWVIEQGQAWLDRVLGAVAQYHGPETQDGWFTTGYKVFESFVIALFPFHIIFCVIFFYSLRPLPKGAVAENDAGRVLWAYLPIVLALFLATVWALYVHRINPFRVYPAVVPLTLLFFWRVDRFGTRPAPMRWTWLIFAILVVVVVQARFQHIQAGPAFCKVCRMQAPYPEVAEILKAEGYDGGGTIIAGDNYIAGNFRVHFPEARILTPRYPEVVPPLPTEGTNGPCLIVWHNDMRDGDRRRFDDFIETRSIVLPPLEEIPLREVEVPHTPRIVMPNRTIEIRYVLSKEPIGTCG